jgi:ABC-type phosphate transport system substrate-binding protein
MKRYFLTLAALSVLSAAPAAAQGFQVIVHADNPVAAIGKSDLSGIFLKKSTKFPGGKAATPVDQEKAAAARDAFSKAVHGRAATAVSAFWQQQIFAGQEVPPAEKGGDAEVIAFVKSNSAAIGYVTAGATLGAGVKAVAIK